MPYRAMLNTLISVMLALVMTTGWEMAVQRLINRSTAAENSCQPKGMAWKDVEGAHDAAGLLWHPYPALLKVRSAVSMLALLLMGAMFAVGAFATFREWALRKTRPARKKMRTKYVDAWKIAAERMEPPPPEPGALPPPENR